MQRAVSRAPFAKAVSVVATLAAVGTGLAFWQRHRGASKGTHGMPTNKVTWKRETLANVLLTVPNQAVEHSA